MLGDQPTNRPTDYLGAAMSITEQLKLLEQQMLATQQDINDATTRSDTASTRSVSKTPTATLTTPVTPTATSTQRKELGGSAATLARRLLPKLQEAATLTQALAVPQLTGLLQELVTICFDEIATEVKLTNPQRAEELLQPGNKFGCWTLLEMREERKTSGERLYKARSDCGKLRITFVGRELRAIPPCTCGKSDGLYLIDITADQL